MIGSILLIFFMITSLARAYDCPNASEATLKNMGLKTNQQKQEMKHNHNKIKYD